MRSQMVLRPSTRRWCFSLWLAALGCGAADGRDAAGASVDGGGGAAAEVTMTSGQGSVDAALVDASVEQLWTASATPPPAEKFPGPEEAGECPGKSGRDRTVGITVSPTKPGLRRPVTIMAATLSGEEPLAIRVEDAKGNPVEVTTVHRRGVPAASIVRFVPKRRAKLRVVVGRDGKGLRCYVFWARRRARKPDIPAADVEKVWSVRRAWTVAEEALFSAWVRELFAAPRGEDLAFSALDQVTSDQARNTLHNYLGWREDARRKGIRLRPDCADAPYFLRAYFAWKRGLPFGFRHCSRGGANTPPRCRDLFTNLMAPELKKEWVTPPSEPGATFVPQPTEAGQDPRLDTVPVLQVELDHLAIVQRFFSRTLAWGVHTGNGRTSHSDAASDYYPVRLDRRGLRPGTVYADPYGHVFVVVELMAGEGSTPGILYAIDGQPDGSITRKRFWEGNFLWNPDPTLGGSGFKAFRPLRLDREQDEPVLVQLDNTQVKRHQAYGDLDMAVGKLDANEFYDTVDRLVTPGVKDPSRAQKELIDALAEAVRVRITSVDNGERYVAANPGAVIEMPSGHAVFETVGAWENYSTPARDLRILIAMDVVAGFGDKVARRPAAYGIEGQAQLQAALAKLARQRSALLQDKRYAVSYTRSDGSAWTLTLADLFDRVKRLEVAYNPNDCPEVRWAAALGSEEMRTCERRAQELHRAKMEAYRVWFRDRRRPGRGDPGPLVPGTEDSAD